LSQDERLTPQYVAPLNDERGHSLKQGAVSTKWRKDIGGSCKAGRMNWQVSLGDLLQGTLAAVIGLIGAVLAAYLLIRHERGVRAQSAREHADSEDRAALRSGAAAVAAAATALTAELVKPQLYVGSARVRLFEATGAFIALSWHKHKGVADWTQHVAQESIELSLRTPRHWLLPGLQRRREQAAANLGAIIAALPAWAEGNLPDQWFEEDLEKRRQSQNSPKREGRTRGRQRFVTDEVDG
jgi:hypothetical protein